jgi:methylisocitrate lyase
MRQRKVFREQLASGRTIWSAGAYDALSAKMIEAAGFDALLTTGFGISASMLGQPDVELYTMTENLNVVRQVIAAVEIPVVADCDTGYGNAVNVMRTVREFERAGATAVILEDQVVPKRCPAIANVVEVLPLNEGVAKIRAAVEARTDPDLVIIARTDAPTESESIERIKAYVEAGADMVQPISKTFKDATMLKRLKLAAGVPVSLQVLGWLEDLTADQLSDLSGMATFPLVPLMTVAHALRTNLAALAAAKNTGNLPLPRMEHKPFADLLGFDKIQDVQHRLLPEAPVWEQRKAS